MLQSLVILAHISPNIFQLTDHGSDMDEPMASQSADSEAPLTHNSSKNNFFAMEEQQGMLQGAGAASSRGSLKVMRRKNGKTIRLSNRFDLLIVSEPRTKLSG